MIQAVNRYAFQDAFKGTNYENNFSYQGLNALFDYLEEYEESTGEQIELCIVALCCDYTESDLETVLKDYGYKDIEELRENCQVIVIDDETVIYSAH